MASRRNKKYNPNKKIELTYRALFKNIVVVFLTGQGLNGNLLFNVKTMKQVAPTSQMTKILTNIPFNWTYQLIGFSAKPNGTDYLEYETIRTQSKYKHSDLVHFLNDRHKDFLQNMNKSRLRSAGWIASITDISLSEAQLVQLFSSLNAWNPK